jgi:hypothetical protein
MAMVSHLHHFFNAETCQSYIHTLRWKDRPLWSAKTASRLWTPFFPPATIDRDARLYGRRMSWQ